MSNTVIRVENLSKQYRLGQVSTGTLSHDVNRWWHRIRGKEDPYLKIGETNDRTVAGNSDYVWALRDVNFEVMQGEVLGIIGRNGAGKSTLLKILSRTTAPTTGSIKIRGRVASLLEVGTGFHPELSGRENIYLNGAILGMTRHEITRKFDEIVAFAGVERYIDTPVKRYSSGMYVRLAFAVAAHLEPEILIVDEVLAVGDMEFQKKCILRMESMAKKENRTILFVSHDLKAISSLCPKCVILKEGSINFIGETRDAINSYLKQKGTNNHGIISFDKKVLGFRGISNSKDLQSLMVNQNIECKIQLEVFDQAKIDNVYVDAAVYNSKGDMVIHSKTKYTGKPFSFEPSKKYTINYFIEKPNLSPGVYNLTIYIYQEGIDKEPLLWIDEIPFCNVLSANPFTDRDNDFLDEVKSIVFPFANFTIND